jgi:hypothetical protein
LNALKLDRKAWSWQIIAISNATSLLPKRIKISSIPTAKGIVPKTLYERGFTPSQFNDIILFERHGLTRLYKNEIPTLL